jgi:uncharacterized protein
MDPCEVPSPPPGAPGWYPDPAGSGSYRYWDGTRWTDALSSAIPPAGPLNARDDARGYALAAHLSALLSTFVGLPFVGPLVVCLTKQDDPYVRRHATEALNFNLSILLYAVVVLAVTFVGRSFAESDLWVVPFGLCVVVWFFCVCTGAIKAGRGEEFHYPLTIRFVR